MTMKNQIGLLRLPSETSHTVRMKCQRIMTWLNVTCTGISDALESVDFLEQVEEHWQEGFKQDYDELELLQQQLAEETKSLKVNFSCLYQ